jgi:hypothetical protein
MEAKAVGGALSSKHEASRELNHRRLRVFNLIEEMIGHQIPSVPTFGTCLSGTAQARAGPRHLLTLLHTEAGERRREERQSRIFLPGAGKPWIPASALPSETETHAGWEKSPQQPVSAVFRLCPARPRTRQPSTSVAWCGAPTGLDSGEPRCTSQTVATMNSRNCRYSDCQFSATSTAKSEEMRRRPVHAAIIPAIQVRRDWAGASAV